MKVIKYKLSKDRQGLLAYWTPKNYWHIHSKELSKIEKHIREALKGLSKKAEVNP